jgi:sigma-B regulation protein RsbU (phosphoserine phosphatase)
MSPLALCILKPVTLTPSQLRWDLLNVGVGMVLLVMGLAAISLFFFRFKTRDFALIYFGLFSILYAFRLLANRAIIESVFDVSRVFWDYVHWAISCTILLPFSLFLYQLVGEPLKKLFRWLVLAQAAFAVLDILAAALGATLERLGAANNIMTLATLLAMVVFVLVTQLPAAQRIPANRDLRVFIGGSLVWVVFILHANLAALGVLPGFGGDVQFLGFLVFVCCLGYVTAHRTFATEQRLLEIDKELEIARQIQSATLPREIPKLPGLRISARYVPMSTVAGDFYDFLVDDEKHLGILIADVAGHGIPAALIASMLKVAFAGQSEHVHDPAAVLTGLNLALCGKFEEQYVTAAYIFVDVEKSVMRYAGAGHPPLMLASRPANTVRRIEQNGTILGLFPEAPYTATEIALHSDDRVLLYTDGAFEAMNAKLEEFGKARLEQFLVARDKLSADAFANELLDELARWSYDPNGRNQDDDITLVVVDFQSPEQARG